ncbi:MAG: aldehyde dehydrogenase (NADP(+)) [Trueperaceae bacterium]|nr:aldehyde dehydrogenase (NADP(+)) [Trueperaceae bacterium]
MSAFVALDPRTYQALPGEFETTTAAELERLATAARAAFGPYSRLPGAERARFLRAVADGLEAAAAPIAARAVAESGLPEGRIGGEVARTSNQLRMFARLIETDDWLDPRIDAGDPERAPAPKPDVRSFKRPLGPVAVFGASNFPLAFSVAGGDTASALAAGCPVIAKAHPSHPGTSRLVADVVLAAARATGMPAGVFGLVQEPGHELGQALVLRPEIKAVGFTGSRAGGEALMRLAAARPTPIPVYAEMGSVNPVFVMPGALAARSEAVAQGLFASFTLGVGQFCTNPGVTLVPVGQDGDRFVARLAEATNAAGAGVMLNRTVCERYGQGLAELAAAGGRPVARGAEAQTTAPEVGAQGAEAQAAAARGSDLGGADAQGAYGTPTLWEADIRAATAEPGLLAEVFGPSTLVLRYRDFGELLAFAEGLEGQLTATVQAEADELEGLAPLIDVLAERAGRLILNQYPTGVEVGPAMVHGGPYPATSDGRSTSVGTHAIDRFTRLVAYQNFPPELLPAALR